MLVEPNWLRGGDNTTAFEHGKAPVEGGAKRVGEISEANDSTGITASGKRAESEVANYGNSLGNAECADVKKVISRWACRMPSMERAPAQERG
jgi:hypothetical protein